MVRNGARCERDKESGDEIGMKSMQGRLREHIEFHDAIDSHKSEAAFLREVLEFVQDIERELNRLEEKEFGSYRRSVQAMSEAMG